MRKETVSSTAMRERIEALRHMTVGQLKKEYGEVCRYLMGLYYATWPWMREFVNVNRLGLPAIGLWAYDHLCLFGWTVPLPTIDDRSFIY
jgi:hypothetical protein